jgi:methionyl-tRNA formyltransferase
MGQAPLLRIVYAGTPGFAVPSLRRLVQKGFAPVAVLTQPDRPAGRSRALQASPVKLAAEQAGLAVQQPETLRDAAFSDWLSAQQADLMVVVAYGLILPPEVLRIPRHGCWNVHASLLPRWRGAAPIQRAIEAGDRETGVCIMQMDEGLDTGPVLLRRSIAIAPDETGGSLDDRLAELGAEALLEALRVVAGGSPPQAEPQPVEGVTYARKLDKAEARIDWREAAGQLERRVRAFNPWPVAWCDIGGERTRIWDARALPAADPAPPGTVVGADPAGIRIATGDGLLALLRLQRPGGRPVSAAAYLNARSLPPRLAGAR